MNFVILRIRCDFCIFIFYFNLFENKEIRKWRVKLFLWKVLVCGVFVIKIIFYGMYILLLKRFYFYVWNLNLKIEFILKRGNI